MVMALRPIIRMLVTTSYRNAGFDQIERREIVEIFAQARRQRATQRFKLADVRAVEAAAAVVPEDDDVFGIGRRALAHAPDRVQAAREIERHVDALGAELGGIFDRVARIDVLAALTSSGEAHVAGRMAGRCDGFEARQELVAALE